MDIQMIVVWAIFVVAAFFLGRKIYRSIRPAKNAGPCGSSNCKCGMDFSTEKL